MEREEEGEERMKREDTDNMQYHLLCMLSLSPQRGRDVGVLEHSRCPCLMSLLLPGHSWWRMRWLWPQNQYDNIWKTGHMVFFSGTFGETWSIMQFLSHTVFLSLGWISFLQRDFLYIRHSSAGWLGAEVSPAQRQVPATELAQVMTTIYM